MFDEGHKVYCPSVGVSIYELFRIEDNPKPLRVENYHQCTYEGKVFPGSVFPDVFHATFENKAKLEALYGVEFDEPELEGSELTRKLLKDGHNVLCYVSDVSDELAVDQGYVRLIGKLFGIEHFEVYNSKMSYRFAVPVSKHLEFVVGEVK